MWWRNAGGPSAGRAWRLYRTGGWRAVRAWIDNAACEDEAWRRILVTADLPGIECMACDDIAAALALDLERCRLCRGVGRRENPPRRTTRN
jgi:hypothetical protein